MKTFNPDEPLEFSLLADIEQTRAFTQDRVPEEDQINEEDLCLPSKIEMASNLLRSIKNAGKKILKGEKLSADSIVSEKRLEICNQCPKFIKEQGRCSLCGCFLKAKVRIVSETCPIGKW
tara:strand:+ start:4023 stop:4382 length:360 start_codon:yes stop_codon:yes gene_type:complete